MINLLHMTDGFKVILGSTFVHASALITIAAMIRPPEYEDDIERTERALGIFYALVVMHFCCGVIRGLTLFFSEHCAVFNSFLTFGVTLVIILLCKDWVFPPTENERRWDDTTTIEQKYFEIWLLCEFFMNLSFIATAMIYILIANIGMPTLIFVQNFRDEKKEKDFITASSMLLEVLFLVFAPTSIYCPLWFFFEAEPEIVEYCNWNAALTIVQVLAMFWFIFK